MRTKNLIHPGEILKEEFLVPLGISQNQLAIDIRVPAPRISAIVHGRRAISADTALRLGAYFKMERLIIPENIFPGAAVFFRFLYDPRACRDGIARARYIS